MLVSGRVYLPSTLHLPPTRQKQGRRPREVAEDVVMLAAPAATAAGMTPQEAQEAPKVEAKPTSDIPLNPGWLIL